MWLHSCSWHANSENFVAPHQAHIARSHGIEVAVTDSGSQRHQSRPPENYRVAQQLIDNYSGTCRPLQFHSIFKHRHHLCIHANALTCKRHRGNRWQLGGQKIPCMPDLISACQMPPRSYVNVFICQPSLIFRLKFKGHLMPNESSLFDVSFNLRREA